VGVLGCLVGVLGWRGPEDRGCGGFLAFGVAGVAAGFLVARGLGGVGFGFGFCLPLRELLVLGVAAVLPPALALGVAEVRLALRAAAALEGDFAFVP
jgi:hypothetical protein